jgi:bleomycin hydrolase
MRARSTSETKAYCSVQKYGCIPQTLYPESFSSSASAALDKLLTSKLRECSLELRELSKALSARGLSEQQVLRSARARKEEMMKQVFDVLCITLGTPPKAEEEFVWEYYDRDGKVCKISSTPRDFYKVSVSLYYNVISFTALIRRFAPQFVEVYWTVSSS